MDLVPIGRLRKPFGVEGRLRFEVEDIYLQDFEKIEVIFVQRPDGQVPYFVEDILYDEPATVKLEDVDTKEAAAMLSMSAIALRAEDIAVSESAHKEDLAKLTGFRLLDHEVELGVITDIREYPQQLMAVIVVDGHQILIPLVEQLIEHIDADDRAIYCQLPEGIVTAQMP